MFSANQKSTPCPLLTSHSYHSQVVLSATVVAETGAKQTVRVVNVKNHTVLDETTWERTPLQLLARPGFPDELIVVMEAYLNQPSAFYIINYKTKTKETHPFDFNGLLSYSPLNGGIIAGKSKTNPHDVSIYELASRKVVDTISYPEFFKVLRLCFLKPDFLLITTEAAFPECATQFRVDTYQIIPGNKISHQITGEFFEDIIGIFGHLRNNHCLTIKRGSENPKLEMREMKDQQLTSPKVVLDNMTDMTTLFSVAALSSGNFYIYHNKKLCRVTPPDNKVEELMELPTCEALIAASPGKLLIRQKEGWSMLDVEYSQTFALARFFVHQITEIPIGPSGVMVEYFDPEQVEEIASLSIKR